LQRKVKRVANALKNKLEKEKKAKEATEKKAKAAREKEVKAQATASKKALKKQPNCTALKGKTAALIVPKGTTALPKAKAQVKVSARRGAVVLDRGVVEMRERATKTATRTIIRPQRYL
jgi:hypothetical protein